jgi:hypothetical protein
MLNISRENAIKLISDIRKVNEKEIDFKKYLEDSSSINNMVQTELYTEIQGVSNGFLSEILCMVTGQNIEIYGDVERLFVCPCCGLRTLTEEYNLDKGTGYDICPYCNWEDDGTTDINAYRSINKGSIKDYRNKILTNNNKYYINKWFNK